MKKRQILLVAIMTMVMFCMTACGGKDYAGTYYLDSMKSGGSNITLADYAKMMGISEDEARKAWVIELKSDGTCSIRIDGEDETTGTWKSSGSTVTITGKSADGSEDSSECTMDGDTLTLKTGDEEMVLKKQ